MNKQKKYIKAIDALFQRKNTPAQELYNALTEDSKTSRKILAISSLDVNYPHLNKEDNIVWASLIAAGHQALAYNKLPNEQLALTLQASKELVDAFINAKLSCQIYPAFKPEKKISSIKDKLKFINYDKISRDWQPIADRTLLLSLSYSSNDLHKNCSSCVHQLIKKMGGSEEDAITAAGFSGGIGLSGGVCGSLIAKVWFEALLYLRKNKDEDHYPHQFQKQIYNAFMEITKGDYSCPDLSGKHFKDVKQYSTFIEEGGCNKLISLIAEIKAKEE